MATVVTPSVEAARAVVLFADLSGFAVMTEVRGDTAAADVAVRFGSLVRGSLSGGARLLKTLGDGALIVAPDRASARATARRLLAQLREEPDLLPVRVGMCEGPVVWRGDDVFGATVNNAARLADAAEPWEILEGRTSATSLPAPA